MVATFTRHSPDSDHSDREASESTAPSSWQTAGQVRGRRGARGALGVLVWVCRAAVSVFLALGQSPIIRTARRGVNRKGLCWRKPARYSRPLGGGGREGETKCRALPTPEQPPQEGVPLSTPAFTLISPTSTLPSLPEARGQMHTGAHRGALPHWAQTQVPRQAGKTRPCWPSKGTGSCRLRQGRGVESAAPRTLCSQLSGHGLIESSQPHEPEFVTPVSQRRKPRLRRAKTRCRSVGTRNLRPATLEGEGQVLSQPKGNARHKAV